MARSVEEWIGKTDDSPVPPRVRLRIFERWNGTCYLSSRPIRAGERWDLDHVIALANGGEHREYNLAPVLVEPHREKTREDVALKSKVYRKKAAFLGIKRKKGRPMPGSKLSGLKKGFDGIVRRRYDGDK